jgi:mxaK protein
MVNAARWIARVSAAAGALLLILAARDGYLWWQAHALNRAFEDGSLARQAGALPAQAAFARAVLLARASDLDGALERYKRLETADEPRWAGAARYNAANLHLRRALALKAAGDDAHAMPLLELAKEGYRSALRADPGDWDAKYNLERALRLAPEADEDDDGAAPAPTAAERAPTTMRGFTLGLP